MAAWLKLRLRLVRVCSPASLGGVVLEASPAGWNPADFTDVVPNSNGFCRAAGAAEHGARIILKVVLLTTSSI